MRSNSARFLMLILLLGIASSQESTDWSGGRPNLVHSSSGREGRPGRGPGRESTFSVQTKLGEEQSGDTQPPEEKPLPVEMDLKISMAVSALSAGLMFFPLAFSAWGVYKYRNLYRAVEFIEPHNRPPKRTLSRDVELAERDTVRMCGANEVECAPCTLSFAHLDFWVTVGATWRKKGTQQHILRDVCGYFKPGTVTAVMGPSGCGKTTLLTLLSGRGQTQGEWQGVRLLNGIMLDQLAYQNVLKCQGYVMQTDTFFEDLTVLDTLLYGALLRLPERLSLQDKVQRVRTVLAEVGLSDVADSLVGGPAMKGISGGQRRRLSIALELLRLPSVLLLDEPTSGLDATTSLKLCQTLSTLAHDGNRTIITTIHQPRSEIWNTFDQVLLMADGGRTVFCGETASAVTHLSKLDTGINLQDYENLADFVIDAVGLDPERETTGRSGLADTDVGEEIELPVSAHSEAVSAQRRGRRRGVDLADVWAKSEERKALLETIKASMADPAAMPLCVAPTSFIHQIWVMMARRGRRTILHPKAALLLYAQIFVTGLVIGNAFSYPSDYDWVNKPYKIVMFIFTMSSYSMVLQYLVLVPEYFSDFPILSAERANGSCGFGAYILSCFLMETPRAVWQSAVLLCLSYGTTDLNPEPAYVGFAFICLTVGVCAWQGVVAMCACAVSHMSTVYSVLFMILGLGTLFGGVMLNYDVIPPYFLWAYYLSVPAITARALIINDMLCCHLTVSCQDMFTSSFSKDMRGTAVMMQTQICSIPDLRLDNGANIGYVALRMLRWHLSSKYQLLLALIGLGFMARVFAYVCLRARERRSSRLRERQPNLAAQLSEFQPPP